MEQTDTSEMAETAEIIEENPASALTPADKDNIQDLLLNVDFPDMHMHVRFYRQYAQMII